MPPDRSRAIRIASWITLAATALLIVVFIVQIASFEGLKPRKPQTADIAPPANQITAGRSSIAGYDNEQQPFVFTAEQVRQDPDKTNVVHLTAVEGELRNKDGAVMTVSANGAIYDTDSKVLDLAGNVRLASQGRFVADTDRARVFLDEKRLVTDAPVMVKMNRGKIAANGAEITESGKRVVFLNRVRVTYTPIPAHSKGNGQ